MKKLKHNDKVTISGKFGSIGTTVAGCALQYKEDVPAAVERATENGHMLMWGNQDALVLSNCKEFNERRAAERLTAIPLYSGEIVEIEGLKKIVKYTGDYSDFIHFDDVPGVIKFEVGESYFTSSACDHTCIFSFKIVRRTAKSVWIQDRHDGDDVKRKSIAVWNGVETFKPFGTYSMSPIISADKQVEK